TVTLLLQSSDAFLFNLTTTTEIYTLSLHDALPISGPGESGSATTAVAPSSIGADAHADHESAAGVGDERGLSLEEKTVQRTGARSEEHTSELQSRSDLVCRLLLEKKNK